LKRLNLALDRTGSNHTAAVTNNIMQVAAGDNRWNLPIPQDEMDSNNLMVQNPI
jgi:hypothetical protein